MTQRATLAIVGLVAVAVETALGGLLLATGGDLRLGLYLLVCAVATAVVVGGVWKLLALPPRGPGGGMGGGRSPDGDPPPPWWPEFERDLRAYLERSERGAPR